MFKRRPMPATCIRRVLFAGQMIAGMIAAGLFCLWHSAPPALAKHDEFLFGAPPEIENWRGDLPGESGIAQAPLVRKQTDAIFALYMAPVILGKTDGLSQAELARRARSALELLPDLSVIDEVKKSGSERKTKKTVLAVDGLKFLRWRLDYFAGDKSKVQAEVKSYLAKRNETAVKQGTLLCDDLLALSLDFGRQERYLDQTNLLEFSHYVAALKSSTLASQADKEAVKAYEEHVAQAYTLAQLDRREEASEHLSQAIGYLRPRPVAQRPQTDRLRKALLRLVDEDLIKYEDSMIAEKNTSHQERSKDAMLLLDQKNRQQLKNDISRLTDIAYLAKIDGRLGEASYLFRRAFLLVKRWLPAEIKDYSALCYDLGETLLWDDKFDDSVYYLAYCVQLRSQDNPLAVTAIDTNNLLGRARLSQGQTKKSLDIFIDNLASVAKRVKLKNVDTSLATESGASASARDTDKRDALVAAMVAYYPSAGAEERRQIDDGLQGMIDASIQLKQYDVALNSGEALLKVRSEAVPANDAGVMSVLWGLAYTCDSCAKPERADGYYTRMIESFGQTTPTSLAYWYHGRGLDYDLINKHDLAAQDIKRAIARYQTALKATDDEGTRDHLTWTIADLDYNLKMADKYPDTRPDYANLPDNCRWRLESFPLKIYLDSSKERGFGGELNKLAREAVEIWRDYDGSPIKVEYVDKLSAADIFIERVNVYDDIPYGSAGRTSAIYERKNGIETKVLTKTHVRIYCPSFDGNDWEHQDVKMSSYAKIQFKYLLVHELGHVFGLAHSPAGPDIMYWKSCAQKLSDRDMNSVKAIYKAGRRK